MIEFEIDQQMIQSSKRIPTYGGLSWNWYSPNVNYQTHIKQYKTHEIKVHISPSIYTHVLTGFDML